MDKAKAMQELATMEARRKQLEALLLQEQSPPPKSQTQLKGEQMMKNIYGITDAKVAESMVANILAIVATETQQHDIEMPPSSSSSTFLPQQMHTSPPSMVAFQQPMETSSNAPLNVPHAVGAHLGDRKSEVSLHPSDSISQVSTASGRGKPKYCRGKYADIIILPQNLNFTCFCNALNVPILKGSMTTHADCPTHNNYVRDLLTESKDFRAYMKESGWTETAQNEYTDKFGNKAVFQALK